MVVLAVAAALVLALCLMAFFMLGGTSTSQAAALEAGVPKHGGHGGGGGKGFGKGFGGGKRNGSRFRTE